jgi:LysM domain
MNATRAAALPGYRTENPRYRGENLLYRTGKPARFRPDLRVVYRQADSATGAPAAPSAAVHPAAAPPVVAPARPAPARPAPALSAPARPAVSPSSAASPLRLTRRGRIVVAVMAALLVAGLSLAVAGAAQATGHTASQRATGSNLAQVVVRPGQTLWSVAENADPNADPRMVIQQIAQLNALTSDTLMAGQRLWVPRS